MENQSQSRSYLSAGSINTTQSANPLRQGSATMSTSTGPSLLAINRPNPHGIPSMGRQSHSGGLGGSFTLETNGASSSEGLRDTVHRSNYATRHTIGFGANHHNIRTSSGLSSMIANYEERTSQVIGEFGQSYEAVNLGGGGFSGLYPNNLRQYQQSQLLPIKGSTSQAASAGFARGSQMMQGGTCINSQETQVPSGFFFESPSKYVQLKVVREQSAFYYPKTSLLTNPLLMLTSQCTPVFDPTLAQSSNPRYNIKGSKEWFERLCLQDRSIVLTVVDKQLVNLIFQMYKVYHKEGNVKFFNHQYLPDEASKCERVRQVIIPHHFGYRNYSLMYRKGSKLQDQSGYLKSIHEAENAFISNIRLLNLQSQNHPSGKKSGATETGGNKKKGKQQKVTATSQNQSSLTLQEMLASGQCNFDTLTLDLAFYKSHNYFFEITWLANNRNSYLQQEMIFDKDPQNLEQSVFYWDTLSQRGRDDINYNQEGYRSIADIPQKFWTFTPKIKATDPNGMTLGKCLLLIFEKAISVQYADYLSRLDKPQQSFFFLSDPATFTNLFIQDQRLTHYCTTRLCKDPTLKEKLVRHLEVIERELSEQETAGSTQGAAMSIREEDEEEDGGDSRQRGQDRRQQRLKMILMQEEEEISRALMVRAGEDEEEEEDDGDIGYNIVMGSKYKQDHQKRVKGFSSNQAKFITASSNDYDDEEDLESYRYPKIRKNYSSSQHFDDDEDDEDDEEPDLESQRKQSQIQSSSGRGAVGKLKALRNSKLQSISTKQPFQIRSESKNVSLQDDDADEYPSDFDKESSENEEEESKYFNQFGANQSFNMPASQSKVQVLSVVKPTQQISQPYNPLMNQNKYFFWKREMIKCIEAFTSSYCSQDILDMQAFSFIKSLSTFISLEGAMTLNQKGAGKSLNFSSKLEPAIKSGVQGVISNLDQTLAIPFKQKLYDFLVKMNEDSTWEDILEQDDQHATAANPSIQEIAQPSKTASGSAKPTPVSLTNSASKPSESNPKQQPTDSHSDQPVQATSKSKKKRDKKKKKNEQALASNTTQIDKYDPEIKPVGEQELDEGVANQIRQEQYNLKQVREMMMQSAEEMEHRRPPYVYESGDLYRDSCTMVLPPSQFVSRGLGINLEDEINQAMSQKRHIEERTSLLTGQYHKDKYADDYFLDPTTSASMRDHPEPSEDNSSLKRAPVLTYHSVLHNPANAADVEMHDEAGQQGIKNSHDPEQKQDAKKKKRKKNKKSKKKGKGDQADNPVGEANLEEDIESVKIDDIKIEIGADQQIVKDQSLDIDTTDPLFTHFKRESTVEKKFNNFLFDDGGSSQGNNSQGKISYELSKEDQEYFDDTRKLGQRLLEEIEIFQQCQELSDCVASQLVQSAIEGCEQEDENVPKDPQLEPETAPVCAQSLGRKGKKNKKNQKVQMVLPTPPTPPLLSQLNNMPQSKSAKKLQKRLARQAKQTALQQKKLSETPVSLLQPSPERKSSPIEELIIIEEEIQEDVQSEKSRENSPSQKDVIQDLAPQDHFVKFEGDKREGPEVEEKQSPSPRKVVEFQMPNITFNRERKFGSMTRGYNSSSAEDQDDGIRVPKRGSSSRGSSCVEEKIHQDTIDMLEELFPQEYNNPSPDTKMMISKITSSSSDSNKDPQSIEKPTITSPEANQPTLPKSQRPSAHGPKFVEEPYPKNHQSLTNQNKRRGNNNHRTVGHAFVESQPETQLRMKPKPVRKAPEILVQAPPKSISAQPQSQSEFQEYEGLFKQSEDDSNSKEKPQSIKPEDNSSLAEVQSSNLVANDDSKSELSELQTSSAQVSIQDNAEEIKEHQDTNLGQVLPDQQSSQHAQVSRSTKQKKKGNKGTAAADGTQATSSSIVKEMKERGAIARPSDIENAAQKGHGKKDKQRQQNNQQEQINASGFNIQRSQTPNAQIEGVLQAGTQKGHGGHNNHAATPAQPNKGQKQQSTKQAAQKASQNQSTKRKQGANQTKQSQPPQAQPLITPFEQLAVDPQQQFQALFQQTMPSYNIIAMQNQLLMNQQAAAFGLPFNFNPSLGSSGNFLHQQLNPSALQGNPYFGTQDFSNYNVTSFQTQPGQDLTQEILQQQTERNSQQTQTDETRVKDQHGGNLPVVMNQYQNINVQVHLPGQGHQSLPSPLGASQMGQTQNPLFMYPNFQFGGQSHMDLQQQLLHQQMLQNQFLQQQALGAAQNQMFLQNIMGGINDPSLLQNLLSMNNLQQQSPMMFNPFLFGGQQPFNVPMAGIQAQYNPSHPGVIGNLGGLQTSPLLLNHNSTPLLQPAPLNLQTSQQPQAPTSQQSKQHQNNPHRSPSFNPSTSGSFFPTTASSPFHQHQHQQQSHSNTALLQSLLTELALQSNRPPPAAYHSSSGDNLGNQGGESQVSHMTQDQYLEMNKMQRREEQFYFKVNQEMYKLQETIKYKLACIEGERASVIRRIEAQVRETYSECPNAKIQMYGSMATGLAIDSSDMDLLISGIFNQNMKVIDIPGLNFNKYVDRHMLVEYMRRLFATLSLPKPDEESQRKGTLRDFIESSQIIETASVPVIKLVIDLQKIRDFENGQTGKEAEQIEEDMRLLKIDITFNEQENEVQDYQYFNGYSTQQQSSVHMGIKCCNFIKEQLQNYTILESITLVLKKFLAIRNLNSPFQGGLNSYGLIILIMAYLKQDYEENLSPLDGSFSAARTLRGFLFFYSRFDPNKFLINSDQMIITHQNFSSVLIIQDPLNPQNNIGKSTFNFDTIKAEFGRAHDIIAQIMDQYLQEESDSLGTQEEAKIEEGSEEGLAVATKKKLKKLDILAKMLKVSDTTTTITTNTRDIVKEGK